jgi:ABC-type proline/glycine betaine transport system substrate-binding protein
MGTMSIPNGVAARIAPFVSPSSASDPPPPITSRTAAINAIITPQVTELAKVFAPISEKLDNETLQELNAAVDVDGETPEEVARQFLRENRLL